ncbi:MAG: hypothetical protein KUG78_17125 [Kangiellaceae bacterium]|nr:hypothetical protein [Kangiellaceae bacterium]
MVSFVLKSDLEKLLGYLCVEYGFCIRGTYYEAISSKKIISSEEFVSAVFVADRTGQKDREHYAPIFRELFVSKFGKRASFWNRKFLHKKRKRLSKRKKLEVILLSYARSERMNDNRTYDPRPPLFRGTRELRLQTKTFNKKMHANNNARMI